MSNDPTPTQVLATYAAAFEETYKDDDWKRLEPFFAEDAVYSVVNLGPTTCSIRGRDAILAGLRKSVDGLDRRFATRSIDVVSGPEENGTNVRVDWRATYTDPAAPDLTISAFSVLRAAGGRIVELLDVYDAGVLESLAAWAKTSGKAIDPSYV